MKRTVKKLVAVMLAGLFMMSASVAGLPTGIFKIEKVYGANEIAINTTNFPDPLICQILSDKYDNDNDGCIDNVADVTHISTYENDYTITSLAGIEKFTELRILQIFRSTFEAVDLTACTKLQTLTIANNQNLTTVNVTGLEDIYTLSLYNNPKLYQIIGVNNLPSLLNVDLYKTALTSLDMTASRELRNLYIYSCQLETLNVAGLSRLTYLSCYDNKLTELNLEGCTSLAKLYCGDNNWTSEEPIKLGDIYNLTEYTCNTTKDTSQKIKKVTIQPDSKLVKIDVSGNAISSLDVTNATLLQELTCTDNPLKELKVNNSSLSVLTVGSNEAENVCLTVDVTNCPALTKLVASGSIASVVVNNANLETVNVNSTHLWTLDLSNVPALKFLTVKEVNELVMGNRAKLRYISIENVELERLDLSNCNELYNVTVKKMPKLSAVDLTGCVAMQYVSVYNCEKLRNLSIKDSAVLRSVNVSNETSSMYGGSCLMALDLNPNVTDVRISNVGVVKFSVTERSYDLKNLLPTLDGSKISNVKGGTYIENELPITDTVISGIHPGNYIYYDYDCGNGQIMDCKLWVNSAVNSWVSTLTMEDWTYGKKSSEPYAEAMWGTVKYTYSDSATGTFTKTKPTKVGKWYVKAEVSGNNYYEALNPMVKSFEIHKATPEYTLPTNLKGYVGQTLADVKLPEGFQWRGSANNVLARPGKVGSVISYPLMYVPEDTDNYVTVYNLSVFVEVITSGDINGDDVINVADAVALKKVLAGINENIVEADSDVNMDGVINVTDAVILMKFLAGQDVEMGVAS